MNDNGQEKFHKYRQKERSNTVSVNKGNNEHELLE